VATLKTICEIPKIITTQGDDPTKVENEFPIKPQFLSQTTNENAPILIPNTEDNNDTIQAWTDGSFFKDENLTAGACILLETQPTIKPISYHYTKVEDTIKASSTTTEHIGIQTALSITPRHKKLEIMTDSQNSINNMTRILTENLSTRDILKLSNHFYIETNAYLYKQFSHPPTFHKVDGHKGIYWNDQADNLARHAATTNTDQHRDNEYTPPSTHPIHNTPLSIPQNMQTTRYMFRNQSIIQQYPSKHIKQEQQLQTQQATNHYLAKKHQTNSIDTHISIKLTNQLPRKNHLDIRFIHEMKFRIKLLNKTLSTNKNLQKRNIITNPSCPFCDEDETIEHIWSCKLHITDELKHELYKTFTQNLQQRYKEQHTNDGDLTSDPNTNTLLKFLSLDQFNVDLLENLPHTNGIITHHITTNLQKIPKINTSYNRNKSKTNLLLMILDCWYNAIYKTIWIARNKKTYENTPRNNTQPIPQPMQNNTSPNTIRQNLALNERRNQRQRRQQQTTTMNPQTTNKRKRNQQQPEPQRKVLITLINNTVRIRTIPANTLPIYKITKTSIRAVYPNENTPPNSTDTPNTANL
jgi:ribonuclease HI